MSIAGLHDSVSVAEALSFRQGLHSRVGTACQDLSPLLLQWGHMHEGHGAAADNVARAIGDALTNVPLINGARCTEGARDQGGSLGALQSALDRGLRALQVRSSGMSADMNL